MSHKSNDTKTLYVITYKELIFTFIVFVSILVVLYPKNLLKEQILAENSNYDLSMLYLKNLLQHDPKNESLMLILAEQSLRSGNKDLSTRLLDLLLKSKNMNIKKEATLLSYDFKKEKYYYLQNKKEQKKQKKILKHLLNNIYSEKMYTSKSIEKWYNEAVFLNQNNLSYSFAQLGLRENTQNLTYLSTIYYYLEKSKKYKDVIKYNNLLLKYDKKHYDKWILNKYYTLVAMKSFSEAEKILLQHYKKGTNSKKYMKILADFYLMQKKYKKSSKLYMKLYNLTFAREKKRDYFFHAVNALQAGGYLQESASLVYKFEDVYIGDAKVRKYLLKLYLATGKLDYAVKLSQKILKKELHQ